MDWHKHISRTPNVCKGRPCIKGTRLMVSIVLDNLAEGVTHDEIIRQYGPISEQDIQACVAFAADLARDEIIDIPEATTA